MVICSKCNKNRAVIKLRQENIYLCKECFKRYFMDKVLLALKRANVLNTLQNKKILVASSGGKDSLNALYIMYLLSKKYDFDLETILVDEGIKGYRELTVKAFEKFCNNLGVKGEIISMKDEFGFSIDYVARLYLSGLIVYKPCTVCGVLKRHIINRIAIKENVDYVVTGHNMDDEVQTFFINIIRGTIKNLAREGILTSGALGFVPRLKPLYYVTDKESLTFFLLNGFETPRVECPYASLSLRYHVRLFLNELEYRIPGMKERLLKLKDKFSTYLLKTEGKIQLKKCTICGQPTTREICRACEIVHEVKRISTKI